MLCLLYYPPYKIISVIINVYMLPLKKCFDSIYRNALWLKLFRAGIQGKMLGIIKCMYEKVKSCVKSCNTFFEFFSILSV